MYRFFFVLALTLFVGIGCSTTAPTIQQDTQTQTTQQRSRLQPETTDVERTYEIDDPDATVSTQKLQSTHDIEALLQQLESLENTDVDLDDDSYTDSDIETFE